MKIVLDASAIISGLRFEEGNEYLITDDTIKEIHDKTVLMKVELSLAEGSIRKALPGEKASEAVDKKVEELGDRDSLSRADLQILSLAYELKKRGKNVLIATDDYGIQNIAKALSIGYVPIAEKGIKKIFEWNYVCTGCGDKFRRNTVVCEFCGNKVKKRVKKTR